MHFAGDFLTPERPRWCSSPCPLGRRRCSSSRRRNRYSRRQPRPSIRQRYPGTPGARRPRTRSTHPAPTMRSVGVRGRGGEGERGRHTGEAHGGQRCGKMRAVAVARGAVLGCPPPRCKAFPLAESGSTHPAILVGEFGEGAPGRVPPGAHAAGGGAVCLVRVVAAALEVGGEPRGVVVARLRRDRGHERNAKQDSTKHFETWRRTGKQPGGKAEGGTGGR